tara:strand:+ start:174 stop:1283 length:1110 start_codon:yes stop_codon:yes gene_type:complete
MAIAHLAGNRATGTASDRTGLTTYSTKQWVELGRATLSSAGDTLDLTGLDTTDYPHLMILATVQPTDSSGSETYLNWRFNDDSQQNYKFRYGDSGSEGTQSSGTQFLSYAGTNTQFGFTYGTILNKSDKKKLITLHNMARGSSAGGGGNAPVRRNSSGYWDNSSSAITKVTAMNTQTSQGDLQVGTQFVLLGAKSSGTNTDKQGFWQELADVELTQQGTLSTGDFTAKKWLMIQVYSKPSSSTTSGLVCNGDTSSSNYANRRSHNGASDQTRTSSDNLPNVQLNGAYNEAGWSYATVYACNLSDKEKLFNVHHAGENTDSATALPRRVDAVGKWTNTSDQITSLQLTDGAGSTGQQFVSGSRIKVWGAD